MPINKPPLFRTVILLSTTILITSTALSQVVKKTINTDSTLTQICKRLEKIENKISEHENIKYSPKDDKIKEKNKRLEHEKDSLITICEKHRKKYDSLNSILKNQEKNYQTLNNQLNNSKSKFTTLNSDFKTLITNEKLALETEINSILKQSYLLPEDLINSLDKRSKGLEEKPSNCNLLKDYLNLRKSIADSYHLLEVPYNEVEVLNSIKMIESITIDQKKFTGLFKNKEEILPLLKGYCKQTNELKVAIDNAKILPDESQRKKYLRENEYKSEDIPYLVNQFQMALKDKTHKLDKVNCQ